MNTTSRRLVAAFMLTGMLGAPTAAWAATVHKAQMQGVQTWSNDSKVYVYKTESNGKGVFAHYISGGDDRVTGVNSTPYSTLSKTASSVVTAINACVSNGALPATCSNFNNVK